MATLNYMNDCVFQIVSNMDLFYQPSITPLTHFTTSETSQIKYVTHALQLVVFEHLPGVWFGVAMEYILTATLLDHSKGPCQPPTRAKGVTGSLGRISWEKPGLGLARAPAFVSNG